VIAWKKAQSSRRQVLVRLEDEEFRASYEQAKGALDNARAYLDELEHGSRPEEIQEANII